jgi:hypothetical protein
MSQVISIKVPEHCYTKACAAFQKEVHLGGKKGLHECGEQRFMIFYDENFHEIRCEGNFPDSVFSSLVKINEQFGGKLLYEGEEWHEENDEVVNEGKPLRRIWVFLSIIFFPVTLLYVLLRTIVWIPYKVWKSTR